MTAALTTVIAFLRKFGGYKMYYLNLDENNYLLSVSEIGGGIEADIELADYDFSGIRLNSYKWESGSLMFDEERFYILEAERVAQEEAEKQQISYEQRVKDLEAALDLLLSGAVE